MSLLENLSGEHVVGPVCHELDIAPSTYYWHQQRQKHPERRSCRDKRDAMLIPEIQRVYGENYSVYCVRKVWRQLKREGVGVARCTIERLMKALQLRGGTRGKSVRTTRSSKAEIPQDRVNRQFVAERPDSLWMADFTYVSTWQGFAYVAFIIDVFAGVIVGWRVSSTMETSFVLDALEQALWASTGSTGDSYDNAMADNGLYKAEVIHRQSWKTRQDVELATLKWVDWYNHHRLMERTGYIPPVRQKRSITLH